MGTVSLNKMFLLLIFLLAVSVFSESAFAEEKSNLNDIKELWLETTITIPVEFIEEDSSNSLEYLKINYSWIPEEDYRQKLESYKSSPKGDLQDDQLIIEVNEAKDFLLFVDFSTYTTANPVKVRNKVSFPLKGVNSSIIKYTSPSEKIDINEDIRKQASEIAAGEDDLYMVVFKLADWVNSNIEYNLSSATVDASLPSSWVLENRYGVCDEISNLFISMCRSLGIPARFVSGIAYTDDERFDNEWGAHGWAEVYFPGYGWIPFDPTYDQLGYVDATHIKFDDNLEGSKNAIEYSWRGRNIDVSSGSITINGIVMKEGTLPDDDFSIDVGFMRKEVDLGSYNVVSAVLENNRNYYVAARIGISRTQDLQIIGEELKDVILKPNERKTIYWIIKVENLDPGYIYTFPITVYSSMEQGSSKFSAQKGKIKVSLQSAQNFISSNQVYVSGPKIECSADRQTVYVGETATINCESESSSSLKFCIEDKCSFEKNKSISRNISFSQEGFSTVKLSAANPLGGNSTYVFLSFNVLDEANVSMNVEHPEKIMFDDKQSIQVSIKRESSNIPQNASIKISTELFFQEWMLSNLDENKEFILDFYGKDLRNGKNKFIVNLEYYDELGKKYTNSEEIEVELYGLTFFQKIYVWLNRLVLTM